MLEEHLRLTLRPYEQLPSPRPFSPFSSSSRRRKLLGTAVGQRRATTRRRGACEERETVLGAVLDTRWSTDGRSEFRCCRQRTPARSRCTLRFFLALRCSLLAIVLWGGGSRRKRWAVSGGVVDGGMRVVDGHRDDADETDGGGERRRGARRGQIECNLHLD